MVPEEIYLSIPGFEAGERGGPSSIGGAQAPSRGRTGQEVSVGARLPGGRGVTFRTSASKMPQRVWPFQVGSPENSRAGSRQQEAHSVAVQRNINTSCRIRR